MSNLFQFKVSKAFFSEPKCVSLFLNKSHLHWDSSTTVKQKHLFAPWCKQAIGWTGTEENKTQQMNE